MMKDAAVDLDGITPRGIGWINNDMLALRSGEKKGRAAREQSDGKHS